MIPTHNDSDRKGAFGSRIGSGTGSEEIAAQDFGYTEDEMSVRNRLQDFFTQPLAKFDYAFLVTGWAEVALLA